MITEDYVSFETAKLLKERGFNEDIDLWYDENGEMFSRHKYDISSDWRVGANQEVYECPTLQMAMKWLREAHNLIILLEVERVKYGNVRYNWTVIDDNSDYSVTVRAKYPVYESACEAAIKYCLEERF